MKNFKILPQINIFLRKYSFWINYDDGKKIKAK